MKGSSAGFLWLEYTVLLALIESRTLLVSNVWFLASILENAGGRAKLQPCGEIVLASGCYEPYQKHHTTA
jgi:hypothetical protein